MVGVGLVLAAGRQRAAVEVNFERGAARKELRLLCGERRRERVDARPERCGTLGARRAEVARHLVDLARRCALRDRKVF